MNRIYLSVVLFGLVFFQSCTHHPKNDLLKKYNELATKSQSKKLQDPVEKIHLANAALQIADSLSLPDSLFYQMYFIKSYEYATLSKLDSATTYYQLTDSMAAKNKDSLYIGLSHMLRGYIESKNNNLYLSEKFYKKSLKILEKKHNTVYLAAIYGNYGSLLYDKGLFKESQDLLIKSYALYKLNNDSAGLSFISLNLANNYLDIGSYTEALKYYKIALHLAIKTKNLTQEEACYNNLGVYYRVQNPDSALFYYKTALKAVEHNPAYEFSRIQIEYNMANIYVDKKQINIAMPIYLRLLNECKSKKNVLGEAIIMSGLSDVYFKQGNHKKSIESLLYAIHLLENQGSDKYTYALKNQLKHTYQEAGKYKEALTLADELKSRSDSSNNYNKQVAIHDLEMYYHSEKISLENEKLNAELKNSNLSLFLRLIVILFLLVLIVFLVILYSKNIKAKKRIILDLEEKNEIEKQLKETKSAQADWFKRIVKQQQNEWMQLSKENEEIRRKISVTDIVSRRENEDEQGGISKKGADQLYRKNMMLRFNLVYPEFVDNIKSKYQISSQEDILFCMLVKTNIPMKDIASILEISAATLTKRRHKLELIIDSDGSLEDFYDAIQSIN